ncbi:MAG: RNA polymerase factor sigma-54 [Rubrivivax sp.]
MGSMNLVVDQRQNQALSPRLQHAVRLLQMSSAEFAATLHHSMANNPFLEAEEGGEELDGDAEVAEAQSQSDLGPAAGDEADDAFDVAFEVDSRLAVDRLMEGAGDSVEGTDNEAEADADRAADDASDRDLWVGEGSSGAGGGDEGEAGSVLDRTATDVPLNAHLHAQLNLLPIDGRETLLARAIVESLDDDGYLRTPLAELVPVVELTPLTTEAELQAALLCVQSLEPAGVAARTVAECLTLQLPAIVCDEMRALAARIVGEFLPALAARDSLGLARKLGRSVAEVEAVCDRIRRLDPRPGWRFSASRVAYVVPDVMVRKLRGEWTVQLNPAVVPRVKLNQVYASLYTRHRNPQCVELGAHLQEARWTLRNVRQRFSTILQVAEAIVQRQRNFLDYGSMAMKPLGLKEIADAVGVHESTVSRVTNNKYMSTPSGVFELKYFFSRAMVSANGSACSGTAIRGLIQDIIEAEDNSSPLSDAEITRQLVMQGLKVARRTVTKYRQMLKFEAVDRRRRHA